MGLSNRSKDLSLTPCATIALERVEDSTRQGSVFAALKAKKTKKKMDRLLGKNPNRFCKTTKVWGWGCWAVVVSLSLSLARCLQLGCWGATHTGGDLSTCETDSKRRLRRGRHVHFTFSFVSFGVNHIRSGFGLICQPDRARGNKTGRFPTQPIHHSRGMEGRE